MALILDIETDSLNAKQIWLVVTKYTQTASIECWRDGTEFQKHIQRYNKIIGHNIRSFDIPILNALWGCHIRMSQIVDTLILSQLFNPKRDGGHSLDNLSSLVRMRKLPFKDFSNYSDEMRKYCINDVEVTHKVYDYLLRYEGNGFSDTSIDLEHKVRYIIDKQQRHGFKVDVRKATSLMCDIRKQSAQIEEEILTFFKPKVRPVRDVKVKYKKDGTLSKVGLYHLDSMAQLGGDHTTIRYEGFNLSSPKQIVERMNEYGWKPTVFTPKGSPKVCEENLNTLPSSAPSAVKNLATWKALETRWKTLESWLDACDSKGRIHGKVFTIGAVTGRMTHADPNMANIVSSEKIYGKESRECLICDDDYVLVDTDASGLELRMLAHYMRDDEFMHEVVNGDPHTVNMKAAGLSSRSEAKTFIYAFLYGAGAEKIGRIVGGNIRSGSKLKKRFLSNMPALKNLIEKVIDIAERNRFVKGLDGRKLHIRSPHAALNTLLQGAGAIVCKQWVVEMDKNIRAKGVDANLVCSVHDQYVYEVHKRDVDTFSRICYKAIEDAGHVLKVRCPLTCEVGVGFNWYEAEH